MAIIYWALILILGTIGTAIIVYALVVIGSCGNPFGWSTLPRTTGSATVNGETSSARLDFSPYSASSFKYRKELLKESKAEAEGEGEGEGAETECVVCLLGFEDDEEVRRLHRCKHSFHAPCIDMWMYTHSNCPVCRTPVERRSDVDFSFSFEDTSSSVDVLTVVVSQPHQHQHVNEHEHDHLPT